MNLEKSLTLEITQTYLQFPFVVFVDWFSVIVIFVVKIVSVFFGSKDDDEEECY